MAETERREFLRKPFLLPADVLVFSVKELAAHIREELGCSDDDYAVTRPGMRSFSRIVDGETARLLEEFRQPSPLVDAILRYSLQNGLDPQAVLEEAFPMLVSFSEAAFLVPADSPLAEGVSASYAAGQVVGGYEVRRLIQVLEDTELYLAQGPDGAAVALKIARLERSALTMLVLSREAAILEHLDGACGPRLIEYGAFRERPFLVTSWLSGIPIGKRAQELRAAATPGWREQLHRLCCRLIQAYAALHGHGVIHGDIHPRNVLVDAQDTVMLLDFGLSRWVGRSELEHALRAGLAWFVEPEMAEPVLRGQEPPPASFLGEQYAVAALVYFLVCGEHYLTAGSDRQALYRQVVEAAPPPFTRRGFESWPQVEAVLRRALSKSPGERYRSMADFAAAFQQARPPEHEGQRVGAAWFAARQTWVEAILDRTAYNPRPYDELFPEPPTASVYFGATGLSWFLYRAAQVREEAHLLAAAEIWSRWALLRKESPGGFDIPGQSQAQEQAGRASFFLREPGVHQVYALVSHSRGELSSAHRRVQAFMQSAENREDGEDLIYGRGGVLAGGALLLEALQWSARGDAEALAAYLREQAGRAWAHLQSFAPIGDKRSLPHLGVAHGWAGMLYAQLRVHHVLQLAPPDGMHDRLVQLARQAEPAGRGVSWLGTLQHPGQDSETPAHAPGWCSGSAGYVFLWILASELFGEERFLELAEKAAWHAWEHPERFPNLCCGLAGRAFALLRFYRHTGEPAWLLRAQQLAGRAFDGFKDPFNWDGRTLSLYRGALGPALLAIELERPERAVMPFFDAEGWPTGRTQAVDPAS